jgi:hypothetical protein
MEVEEDEEEDDLEAMMRKYREKEEMVSLLNSWQMPVPVVNSTGMCLLPK